MSSIVSRLLPSCHVLATASRPSPRLDDSAKLVDHGETSHMGRATLPQLHSAFLLYYVLQ